MAVHTKLDKKKTKDSSIESQLKDQAEISQNERMDAVRQKDTLLTYVDYVKARHEEILNGLERAQEKER